LCSCQTQPIELMLWHRILCHTGLERIIIGWVIVTNMGSMSRERITA
jgi:hypothetical protein